MFSFYKKKKEVITAEKVNETLIKNFDIEAYLEANQDLEKGIEKGQFKDPWQHLELFGLNEIKNGDRKFHKDLDVFSEGTYLKLFPEVETMIKEGNFSSIFDHFCKVGYTKLLEQQHNKDTVMIPPKEDVPADQSLIKGFDEKAYLEANPDVKEAIEKGEFSSASLYMELFGFKRIEEGNGRFHKDFDPYDESHYLEMFLDVKKIVENRGFLSGFEHFAKCGYDEIIHGKRVWKNSEVIGSSESRLSSDTVSGKIESYENGKINAWISSKEKEITPLLLIDGKPCRILKNKISLSAIAEQYGFDDDNIGLIAEPAFNYMESTHMELYAVGTNSLVKLDETDMLTVSKIKPNTLKNLEMLRTISQKQDSVLIVVWDVTHNPIGRAKVLYDSVKKDRPVAMVGFDFGLTSAEVWEPIMDVPLNLFSMHWSERELISELIDEMQIAFSTVWICKPRLPSFVLADMFSNEKSKFILDIDDNESALSQTDKVDPLLPYGMLGNHLAETILEKIEARSVASASIQKKWGGAFVRHARSKIVSKEIKERNFPPEKIKIGFFGTVRPHKNIYEAAEAIKRYVQEQHIDLEFIVGGHFIPDSLQNEIESLGVKTVGMIPSSSIQSHIEAMDVIVAAYPSEDKEDEITKYQISSKIGDALRAGRPVLVPEGNAVDDLASIDGIYLFSRDNFSEKLGQAIYHKETITLPEIFDFPQAWETFYSLEKLAASQKKSDIFTLPLYPYTAGSDPRTKQPTLVLLWKQLDSTLYGRRIDQIARSYKRQYPDHRVIILETIDEQREKHNEAQQNSFAGDEPLIIEQLRKKRSTLLLENIEHIVLDNMTFKDNGFKRFLLMHRILPSNSLFILFPMVNYFDSVLETIDGYHYITDIVDNHLGWKSRYPENIVKQYKILSRNAKCTVFNSTTNMDFFTEHHLLEKSDNRMFISNWYELPILNKSVSKEISGIKEIRILYSGNMNDRVDWKLIDELLTSLPKNVTLYLAGNAQRAVESMSEILVKHHNCKYLGPIDERNLLRFMDSCLFAIVPHAIESTSKYMNPIKIHMYAASGLKCVSTSVPGIQNDFANLKLCEEYDLFIRSCLALIEQHRKNGHTDREIVDMHKLYQSNRDKYVDLIHRYLTELSLP